MVVGEPSEIPPSSSADSVVDRAVDRIASWGLEVPALLLLHMHAPLHSLVENAAIVVHPLLRLMLGVQEADQLSAFLSSRDRVNLLIARLEERSR
jgi:hypothetical protein